MLRRHFINVSYSEDIKPNEIWYRTSNEMMYDMQAVIDAFSSLNSTYSQSFTLLSNTQRGDNWWCLTFLDPVIYLGMDKESLCLYPLFSVSSDIFGMTNSNCLYVTDVKLSNVLSIGSYAFEMCRSLSSITIPDSVISIEENAFKACTSLPSITIGNSVTSIGKYAFDGCSSLTSVTIGNSVTSIGYWAFNDCSSLTSIVIPDSVTSIGNYAFEGCESLTSVTIGNSVTSIGNNAFYGTGIYNDESNWENRVLYISNCLIKAKSDIAGAYTIKDDTQMIGSSAFNGCYRLTSITIPESVTSIGNGAFHKCSKLTSVNIPNSVKSIEINAFSLSGLTSVTIPNSVTIIELGTFYLCPLTSVSIPNSVTSIGKWAFLNCLFTSITIPNSVTSIGDEVFYNCESLNSITFEGTIEQWNAITKGVDWNTNVPATVVHCTDGDVTI